MLLRLRDRRSLEHNDRHIDVAIEHDRAGLLATAFRLDGERVGSRLGKLLAREGVGNGLVVERQAGFAWLDGDADVNLRHRRRGWYRCRRNRLSHGGHRNGGGPRLGARMQEEKPDRRAGNGQPAKEQGLAAVPLVRDLRRFVPQRFLRAQILVFGCLVGQS
jgi:hypothetical protein